MRSDTRAPVVNDSGQVVLAVHEVHPEAVRGRGGFQISTWFVQTYVQELIVYEVWIFFQLKNN